MPDIVIEIEPLPYQTYIRGNVNKTTKFNAKSSINYDNYVQSMNYGFSDFKETFEITFLNLTTYPQIKFDLYGEVAANKVVKINLADFTVTGIVNSPSTASIAAKCTSLCTAFELLSAIRHFIQTNKQSGADFNFNTKTYNIVSNLNLFNPTVTISLNSITIVLQCNVVTIPTINSEGTTITQSSILVLHQTANLTSLINFLKNVRQQVAYSFNTFPDTSISTIVKQPTTWDTTTIKTPQGYIHTLSCSLTTFY
jgi:hypothetical protein